MKKIFAIIVFICLLSSEYSYSTPSTQIWIPSTDFQKWKTMHFGFDNFLRTSRVNGVRGAGMTDLGLTTGLLPFEKFQGEIGVDYLYMGDNIYDNHPVYFNAKIGMPEDAMFKNSPAIAFGAFNFGTKKNLTDYNVLYGVIAKTLPIVGRLTVGYYTGNEKVLVDENLKKANNGVLLSWDRTMTEISDKLWLAVDYQGGKNGYGALSAAFAWKFAPNVGVIFGYDIYNESFYKPTATIQLDIDF